MNQFSKVKNRLEQCLESADRRKIATAGKDSLPVEIVSVCYDVADDLLTINERWVPDATLQS